MEDEVNGVRICPIHNRTTCYCDTRPGFFEEDELKELKEAVNAIPAGSDIPKQYCQAVNTLVDLAESVLAGEYVKVPRVEDIEKAIDGAWSSVAKSLGSTQPFESSKFTEDYKDERRLLALAIHNMMRGER